MKERLERDSIVYLVGRQVPHTVKPRRVIDLYVEDGVTKVKLAKTFAGNHKTEEIGLPAEHLFLSSTDAWACQKKWCRESAKALAERMSDDIFLMNMNCAIETSWYPEEELPGLGFGMEPKPDALADARFFQKENEKAKQLYLKLFLDYYQNRPVVYEDVIQSAAIDHGKGTFQVKFGEVKAGKPAFLKLDDHHIVYTEPVTAISPEGVIRTEKKTYVPKRRKENW